MLPALFLFATMVDTVRSYVAQHNFDAAERQVREYRTHSGVTPELAEAVSWIARGQLDAKNYPRADAYAAETRKLSDALLQKRKLDAEPLLPIALGASIEVHAQALAAQGARSEAVAFLRDQAKLFAGTSIVERIGKNLNLLSLEGKPAPVIADLQRIYSPKGLTVIGPTKLFGYAANGDDATPAVEKPYIDRVRRQF